MNSPHGAPDRITLREVNGLMSDRFTAVLAPIFEGEPWVVEAAWQGRPFASVADLHRQIREVLAGAPVERREELIRAHPELAGREADAGELTAASSQEQASASLDRLDHMTLERLRSLNGMYRRRFSFPFVICVREYPDVAHILEEMERRVQNTREQEVEESIEQISKIVRLRLERVVRDDVEAAAAGDAE